MEMKGVKDLMERERYRPRHIQEKLIEHKVKGNWDSIQNVYNLINGKVVPRDAFIYAMFADMFKTSVDGILERYSEVDLRTTEEQKGINW